MFWTIEKITKRVEELAAFRYRERLEIYPLYFQVDPIGEIAATPPIGGSWKEIKPGFHWRGRDVYAWLKTEFVIPLEWKDKKVLGLFDFGQTGHGNNAGFESLLFVNNDPYQGVDTNHREVFFHKHEAGSTLELSFRIWSGMGGLEAATKTMEHQVKQAELCWLDEAADDLYYTAKAALDTIEVLTQQQTERMQLERALDRAFLLIDWSRPGSHDFYNSIERTREKLHQEIKNIPVNHPVTVHGVGHTHIDVAWLWRLTHTREKCARSFSTVLRLMELYPDYLFLQTQPQLYEYIKNDYPAIYDQIKDRVKEGKWETGGGMWLEADCNLTSGESLVRQLLFGTRFFREEFGVECKYLWLPDVFGYSWALPQILQKFGIDTFMTTKISWNQYNCMPHDTFKWRGIDGTEILTHFITTPEVNGESFYTYNGRMNAKEIHGIWDGYRDQAVNQELLLSYGYGDGGGGVNREMLETRRRMDQMPGLPHVKTSRADDYFKQLHQTINQTDQYVHTWDGELYLEYHRGTYTSQAYNKKMNRKLELYYREVEWINVLHALKSGWDLYPQSKINQGWKIILRNQFHDIIPGSSIKEVYEDSKLEYMDASQYADQEWSAAAQDLVSIENQSNTFYTIFQSASWIRDDVLTIPYDDSIKGDGCWMDNHDQKLKAQKSEEGWSIEVKQLPPLGMTAVHFVPKPISNTHPEVFKNRDHGIVTPFYELEWNHQGQLTSIYDVQAEREVLASGCKGNVLQVFEDKPKDYEAWDIDLFYQEKMKEVQNLLFVKVIEIGPVRAVVRFQWIYMDSTVTQDMILYAQCKRIDFKTHVDWQERQRMLKVAFTVDIRSTEATYDIQFGNVKRSTHWNTSWDYARFETIGHQWADFSERSYGVSLLNDCKYGYDIKDQTMRLTLLRSPIQPDLYADKGEHEFSYALYPHEGDWVQADTVKQAWSLNQPLTFYQGGASLFHNKSLIFVNEGVDVMIDAVKKAEDSDQAILRFHEYIGSRGKVILKSDFSIQAWQECDLMERPIENKTSCETIELFIKPYEIKTILVEFGP